MSNVPKLLDFSRWRRRGYEEFLTLVSGTRPNNGMIQTFTSSSSPIDLFGVMNVLRFSSKLSRYKHLLRELPQRKFIFVVGLPRTGGAYLSRVLNKNISPYSEGDSVMGNESVPAFRLFTGDTLSPRCYNEFLQQIAWVRLFYHQYDHIVRKNSAAGARVDLLHEFFKDDLAEVIVTVRHPREVYASYIQAGLHIDIISETLRDFPSIDHRHFINMSEVEKEECFLNFWFAYYRQLLFLCPEELLPRVSVCSFGNQNNVAKKVVYKYTGKEPVGLEEIRNRSESFKGAFWDSWDCERRIQELKDIYSRKGLDIAI